MMATSVLNGGPVVLENVDVRIEIDAAGGGAITRMVHKKATTFGFIAERGAQVAASGRFFVPVIEAGGKLHVLDGAAFSVSRERTEQEQRVILRAALDEVLPGLSLERVVTVWPVESGLHITDTYRLAAGSQTLRVGTASRAAGEKWMLTQRSWFGDSRQDWSRFAPLAADAVDEPTIQTPDVYWRTINQYGVGMLYRVRSPQGPCSLKHRLGKAEGFPCDFQWLSAPVELTAGKEVKVDGAIMVDEGGRAGATPAQRATGHRFLLTLDVPQAGRSGQLADCYATAVAVIPRKFTLTLSARRRNIDWKEGHDEPFGPLATTKELSIEEGLAGVHHFEAMPKGPGLYVIRVEAREPDGQLLAEPIEAQMVVDGQALKGDSPYGKVWSHWTRRLPEVILRGTWEEIGAQLAGQNLLNDALRDAPGERIAYYEKHFPYYARLLRGAAKARGVPVGTLRAQAAPKPAPPNVISSAGEATACMDLLVNGPDGPIQFFSKEREADLLHGLAYCKVIPDQGYRYHLYTLNSWSFGYGINSAGLATSGATINSSDEGFAAAKARIRSKPGAYPAPIGFHMLLAMCKNVDEAIAFLDNPDGPLEFVGNVLISDASGKGVIVNGYRSYHYLAPADRKDRFATGNYPIEAPDSPFKMGPNWGWAANTMLRERAVRRYMQGRNFEVSLRDAFIIMNGRNEPGNMNQMTYDNPGLLYSNASIVMVSRTGDLYLSNGPPHLVEYVRYRLGD